MSTDKAYWLEQDYALLRIKTIVEEYRAGQGTLSTSLQDFVDAIYREATREFPIPSPKQGTLNLGNLPGVRERNIGMI